jgi:ElaB/YqjD/DUF883 family membrane-anchored ribosome-binding protein
MQRGGTCIAEDWSSTSSANSLIMDPQPYQPDIQSSLQAAKVHAREAAEELRLAAEQKIVSLRELAGVRARHFRTSAEDSISTMESYVRTNPSKSVLISLGVGLFLGALWHR